MAEIVKVIKPMLLVGLPLTLHTEIALGLGQTATKSNENGLCS